MSETKPTAETRPDAEAPSNGATDQIETPTTPKADTAEQSQQAARQDDRAAKLEAEVQALKDQLLRSLADAENFRRRAEREREDTAKFAVSKFAKELLAVADNLRRAVESVSPEGRQQNEQVDTLLTGVEATERQLVAAFERAGIQKLDPVGQPFDPNFHQVMMELEGTGRPPGTVVQVLQSGYSIHGRLLREAIVGVAKGPVEGQSPRVDTTA